jgi:hypothetical protein
MSLTEDLQNHREESRKHIPEDKLAVMMRAVEDLKKSGIADMCLTEGDMAPDFTLSNAMGKSVSLSDTLKDGPVVLSFYRGAW